MSVLTLGAARAAIFVVAAAGALALATVPSAAHAAEVVTCTPQATPETAPWLAFSQQENFYEILGSAENEFISTTSQLSLDFPAEFTAEDLADYQAALEAAEDINLEAQEQLGSDNPIQELAEQLEAADPDNATGWQENFEALLSAFYTGSTDYQTAFIAFGEAQDDFIGEAEATLEADVPAGGPYASPVLPDNFEATVGDVLMGVAQIVGQFQTIVLDGAAAYVVYEDVCVTTTVADVAPAVATEAPAKTLAATGTSDGIAVGSIAGLLLLAGAAVSAIGARRRSA